MRIPFYQKLLYRLRWILFAFLTVGAILGAINNAISLFPPYITYFGTVIVTILAITARLVVSKRPFEWVIFGQTIRIKNPKAITNTAIAIVILLWVPRVGDWIRVTQIQETDTQGYLIPANDINPPNPCEESIPEDAILIYLGNSVAYVTGDSSDIFTLAGESVLSFRRTPEGISINATLRSKDGRGIVVIENNEFIINRNNFWYKKRPDKHTLEVYDEFKQRVLYIRYLNEDAIKVVGVFYAKDPSIPPIKIEEDKQFFASFQTSAGCIGTLRVISDTFILHIESLPKKSLEK
ncbi:MAG: hypothetical protein WBP93_23895 [Pyrinomonadaceae bacterium]